MMFRVTGTRPLLWFSFAAAAFVALGSCSKSSSSTTPATGGSKLLGTVERGRYLVDNVLVCGECHTPTLPDGKPDMSKYLAGSRSYDFKYRNGETVSVYAENLTSHKDEGLAMWSDDDVRTAITVGIDDEHVALWPIMPYPMYSQLTREDLDSIIKYLRTIPSNPNVVPPDTLPNPDSPAPQIKNDQVPHAVLPAGDPLFAAAERGRYLSIVACLQCHTPEIRPDETDFTKAFSGGRKYKSRTDLAAATSTNITPHAKGLAGWSIMDVVDSIKTNTEKGTNRLLCSTMPGGMHRMGDMTDADLKDIATYILHLPPIDNGPFKCDQP